MLEVLRARLGHVSNERLLSGQGLLNLAQSLAAIDGRTTEAGTAEEVTESARRASCPACVEAVSMFSTLLGSAAGDLALTVGARGGIYLAGGVCLRLGPLFDRAAFRRRFVDKGRMRTFLEPIPTWLVLRGDTGLIGAAHHRLGDGLTGLPEGEFWRFSVERYAAPGVAEACLTLQDSAGVDVNLILLALWLGGRGHRLAPGDGERLAALAADWQGPLVTPLRSVRRLLKERRGLPWDDAISELRTDLASIELALEQVEQLLLERALGPVTQAAADLDAARTNFLVLGLAGVLDTEAAMLLFATLLDGSVAER